MKPSSPGNTILVISSLCFGAALALTIVYLLKGKQNFQKIDSYSGLPQFVFYEKKIEALEKKLADVDGKESKVVISSSNIPQLELDKGLQNEVKRLRAENSRILQEHEGMRQSLAMTNRIISELEFRVETHSRSFRPLKVEPRGQEQNQLRAIESERLLPPIRER